MNSTQDVTVELPEEFIEELVAAFPAATTTEEAARMAMQFAVRPRSGAEVTYRFDSEVDRDE